MVWPMGPHRLVAATDATTRRGAAGTADVRADAASEAREARTPWELRQRLRAADTELRTRVSPNGWPFVVLGAECADGRAHGCADVSTDRRAAPHERDGRAHRLWRPHA